MTILFLSLGNVNSPLYGELAKCFRKHGHNVTMISPSNKFSDTVQDDIRCITYKSLPLSGGSSLKKGLANLFLPIQSRRIVRGYLKNNMVELVISSTPPIAFYLPIEYIKKKYPKAKHYLILRDIWPEAFNLFDFEQHYPIIYSFFRKQEKRLYKTSDIIGCMSEGNMKFVETSNPEFGCRIRKLYNWGEVKGQAPILDTEIRRKYDLVDRFVLVYGGNMGVPQGLDNIVTLADWVKDKSDVIFLLIGKGVEKERIKLKVIELGLSNVRILDFLPKKDYELLLRTCDVGLISLNDRLKTPSIPSKTITYWNLKMPILAIVDHSTDYGENILGKSKSGLWAYATDKEQILQNFERIYSEKELRQRLGANGYQFLLSECTVEKTYSKIIEQLYE